MNKTNDDHWCPCLSKWTKPTVVIGSCKRIERQRWPLVYPPKETKTTVANGVSAKGNTTKFDDEYGYISGTKGEGTYPSESRQPIRRYPPYLSDQNSNPVHPQVPTYTNRLIKPI